ncbi:MULTISPECIES: protein L [Vibrio]|uniref:protein L n=1 Tax=Vibrio TaxID=662 RepID=UPI001A1BAB25|nr:MULTISPECIES: protein L [Vibrio]EGQ7683088.1 protein L [Vibrio parahaemolyticus]EGR1297484.1 protein L [Vibrio alginolyticus]ELA8916036.1 protein L [Vibrio parahaemolyticus]ELI1832708.1 protein L [Vibrio alginolyticus]ELM4049840.1 protein L [Vibrio parahaemolyticus]
MSWYIDKSNLTQAIADKSHWKNSYSPGSEVPISGIYRCTGCKKEITSNKGDPFPPQNHHQHAASQGDVKWKLNVRTNTNGD